MAPENDDADEDQQRRHQKSAADAEHAGHKTNRRAHREDEENIDRNVGDRKVELHAGLLCGFGLGGFRLCGFRLVGFSPEAGRNRSRQGFLVEHSAARCNPVASRKVLGEGGPIAAPLHNRNRRSEGPKNPRQSGFLPRRPPRFPMW
jgi:hypothetical protein